MVRLRPRPIAFAIGLLVLALAPSALAQASAGPDSVFSTGQLGRSAVAPKDDVALASSELRDLVGRVRAGRTAAATVAGVPGGVRVEILHTLSRQALAELVGSLGGEGLQPLSETLAEAVVPYDQLEALEAAGGVTYLRPPPRVNIPQREPPVGVEFSSVVQVAQAGAVAGQHVLKTNAANWQGVGHRGNGVKVGIIDQFSADDWNAAIASGDLPSPSGTYCSDTNLACDIWAAARRNTHGVGVAEVIYDMAPGTQLYLAYAGPNATDLQNAVNYFAGQGVRVISRSESAEYDGPGNGTGGIASVIDNAVGRGMVWLNSAGNSAGTATDLGGYWRGGWNDTDGDGWLDFRPGDESLGFYCGYTLGLRWSDWGAARTDYDLYVYDDPGLTVLDASGRADQAAGAPPIEYVRDPAKTGYSNSCDGAGDVDYVAIQRYAAGAGTVGDVLEFMTNTAGLEHWQNEYSATQPAADTASAGALSVGAVDPWNGTTIAGYSAQGPTNDNRIKPDISAASCVSTRTPFAAGCFNGTSAATPVVAGAAALYIGATNASPAQVKSYLTTRAFVDRGAAGADNVYGVGELLLPTITPPPPPPPPPPAPPPPVVRPPTAVDRVRPTVRAFVSTGFRGVAVKLRYRVFDNSRVTRELVTVYRGRSKAKRISTKFGTTGAHGKTYFIRWRSPRRGKGPWRFCVQAFDRAGNKSSVSCARITLKR